MDWIISFCIVIITILAVCLIGCLIGFIAAKLDNKFGDGTCKIVFVCIIASLIFTILTHYVVYH